MECNKDEAMRAKDIASRKFTDRDFSGAKKFALKAQNLYPGLDSISQMITTLDVHISAENRVSGEMDLYGILGVNPLADDDTIKKQYRKLLLLLHPDKNKSIGADNAFQLVSDAFNVLSDKTKRAEYNTRRHIRMAQKVPSPTKIPSRVQSDGQVRQPSTGRVVDQKAPTQSGSPAGPPAPNGHHTRKGRPRGKYKKSGVQKQSQQAQTYFKKSNTFWTVCTRCKMQYEYMRVYLDQTLKCPNCEMGFVAVEVPPPSNVAPHQPETGPSAPGLHHNSIGNARWSPFSGNAAPDNSIPTSTARESLKRENEGFVVREEGPSKRMREMGDYQGRNYGSGIQNQPGNKNINTNTGRGNGFAGHSMRININREFSSVELKNVLEDKALSELRARISKAKLAREKKTVLKDRTKVKSKERQDSNIARSHDNSSLTESQPKKFAIATSTNAAERDAPVFVVPDPDFHVFDYDRSERCFRENQVWAGYDNDDGMPRFYALIHEVISVDPFELKVSWLNSRTNAEFGALDWVSLGFSKTCGEFWVGKHETTNLLNSFSHEVKFDEGPRGVIQIYPNKGEIWALYKNWSHYWNQLTPDEVIHAYEMVEILNDYNDDQGVYVAAIVKAPGFRTVFRAQPDPKVMKHIPKEEMFRFSHQVPHHILTGYEKLNAPKGFVELDPAATPVELLQVTSDINEEQATGFSATTETQSWKHQYFSMDQTTF